MKSRRWPARHKACSPPQVAPAARQPLQRPGANPVLPQSRSGSDHGAAEYEHVLRPGVRPGHCLLGAEAPALGGEAAALPAEEELPAHVGQVCGSPRFGGVALGCSLMLAF